MNQTKRLSAKQVLDTLRSNGIKPIRDVSNQTGDGLRAYRVLYFDDWTYIRYDRSGDRTKTTFVVRAIDVSAKKFLDKLLNN